MTVVLFFVGLALLVLGSDWLVRGGSGLAKKFRIPDIVIGLTIVSMGTSLPELLVSLFAALTGSSDIAMGNVVGSNIVNILFILGLSALIGRLTVQKNTTFIEIPIALGTALLLTFMGVLSANPVLKTGSMGLMHGIILLVFFGLFLYYMLWMTKQSRNQEMEAEAQSENTGKPSLLLVGMLVSGIALLAWGADLCVNNAVLIARSWGASESLIGLTLVAAGTSLPELFTSVVATIRKESDIAIGNVVGSNIFNILIILGTSSSIYPLRYSIGMISDMWVMSAASLLLFVLVYLGKRHTLGRMEGLIFLFAYSAYLYFLIQRG
ncbi:MAG: calcium/sodium antiporter [Bacteroidota bacterium]